MVDRITLDGATGEGGGQLLRTTLGLAAITGRPTEVVNIRAGRSKPGLSHQHLTAVRAIAAVCGGRLEGAELRSRRTLLVPGPIASGDYEFDVAAERPSAGAVTLVAQAVVPVLAAGAGSSSLTLHGGTHVAWSPPAHYLRDVLAPALRSIGVGLEVELVRWGFYPQGGGTMRLRIEPAKPRPAQWRRRGSLARVRGVSAAANLPSHIVDRQAEAARRRLRDALGDLPVDLERVRPACDGRGTACFLCAEYDPAAAPAAGFVALGAPGKPAETVGREAADALIEHERGGGAVDVHLADQILPFLALAGAASAYTVAEITGHLRTNAWVCERLLGTTVELSVGEPCEVHVLPAAPRGRA